MILINRILGNFRMTRIFRRLVSIFGYVFKKCHVSISNIYNEISNIQGFNV